MSNSDTGLQIDDDTLWDIDFDDLELEDEIASGAFGVVYKGSYCGTTVAVKQLFEPDNEIIQKLLAREVQILQSLRHPNVVNFMGLCNHETGVYIVTEYVGGGHLWSVLKNTSAFPNLSWIQRVQFAIDVSQAMNYLHKRKMLHRDLKTKNLLVDEHMRVKVCDFGFARTIDNSAENIYMTKTGTGLWMAPEMYMGKPYSSKADVFSFGVILREIITRSKPPERRPRDQFGFDLDEFRKDVPSDCPPAFLQLALDCSATNPDDRPDFVDILRASKLLKVQLTKQQQQQQQDTSTASSSSPAPAPPARRGRRRGDIQTTVLATPVNPPTIPARQPTTVLLPDTDKIASSNNNNNNDNNNDNDNTNESKNNTNSLSRKLSPKVQALYQKLARQVPESSMRSKRNAAAGMKIILGKCHVQASLIQAIHQVIQKNFNYFQLSHLQSLLDSLQSAYEFALHTNTNDALWSVIPQATLRKDFTQQENDAVLCYLRLLFRLYATENNQGAASSTDSTTVSGYRDISEQRLVEASVNIFKRFLDALERKNSLSHDQGTYLIKSKVPVVTEVASAILKFNDEQFSKHINTFYPIFSDLVISSSLQIRLVLKQLFHRIHSHFSFNK